MSIATGVLLILLCLSLLVILGVASNLTEARARWSWLDRELKEAQAENKELRTRLAPFRSTP